MPRYVPQNPLLTEALGLTKFADIGLQPQGMVQAPITRNIATNTDPTKLLQLMQTLKTYFQKLGMSAGRSSLEGGVFDPRNRLLDVAELSKFQPTNIFPELTPQAKNLSGAKDLVNFLASEADNDVFAPHVMRNLSRMAETEGANPEGLNFVNNLYSEFLKKKLQSSPDPTAEINRLGEVLTGF